MRVLFYSSKPHDKEYFEAANQDFSFELRFVEEKLSEHSVQLITDESAICAFVNDVLSRDVLAALAKTGVKLIALRCAGFNNVDMNTARELGLTVVRVPAYSPHAVAEHTLCLMLSLNRKVHRAYFRTRDGNFSLQGLLGFDLHGRTLGIIGTGKIGAVLAKTTTAMGMRVIANDPVRSSECERYGVEYVSVDQLLAESDIISLHCPLTPETKHLIDEQALKTVKKGVMIINTSRGAVLDTTAVIKGLKSQTIGYLGLDVYEQESELFFEDHSLEIIQDDTFTRLLTFPNVLITSHQGFFTSDALANIAETTLENIRQFANNEVLDNQV